MRQIFATMRAAVAEATATRAAFVSQIALMALNDLVFVLYWRLLFRRVGTIRGWNVNDLMLLFSIITTVVGISMGLFANSRRMGETIANGGLDSVLTQPVDPLSQLLVRRVNPLALGDGAFGFGLLVLVVRPTAEQFVLFIFASFLGAIVFTSFLVVVSSLTFFTKGSGRHVDVAFNFVCTLCMYPIDLFNGAMKVLMFTAVPVAFLSSFPSRLVQHTDVPALLGLAVVATISTVLARIAFSIGLKRYSSGSAWTRA